MFYRSLSKDQYLGKLDYLQYQANEKTKDWPPEGEHIKKEIEMLINSAVNLKINDMTATERGDKYTDVKRRVRAWTSNHAIQMDSLSRSSKMVSRKEKKNAEKERGKSNSKTEVKKTKAHDLKQSKNISEFSDDQKVMVNNTTVENQTQESLVLGDNKLEHGKILGSKNSKTKVEIIRAVCSEQSKDRFSVFKVPKDQDNLEDESLSFYSLSQPNFVETVNENTELVDVDYSKQSNVSVLEIRREQDSLEGNIESFHPLSEPKVVETVVENNELVDVDTFKQSKMNGSVLEICREQDFLEATVESSYTLSEPKVVEKEVENNELVDVDTFKQSKMNGSVLEIRREQDSLKATVESSYTLSEPKVVEKEVENNELVDVDTFKQSKMNGSVLEIRREQDSLKATVESSYTLSEPKVVEKEVENNELVDVDTFKQSKMNGSVLEIRRERDSLEATVESSYTLSEPKVVETVVKNIDNSKQSKSNVSVLENRREQDDLNGNIESFYTQSEPMAVTLQAENKKAVNDFDLSRKHAIPDCEGEGRSSVQEYLRLMTQQSQVPVDGKRTSNLDDFISNENVAQSSREGNLMEDFIDLYTPNSDNSAMVNIISHDPNETITVTIDDNATNIDSTEGKTNGETGKTTKQKNTLDIQSDPEILTGSINNVLTAESEAGKFSEEVENDFSSKANNTSQGPSFESDDTQTISGEEKKADENIQLNKPENMVSCDVSNSIFSTSRQNGDKNEPKSKEQQIYIDAIDTSCAEASVAESTALNRNQQNEDEKRLHVSEAVAITNVDEKLAKSNNKVEGIDGGYFPEEEHQVQSEKFSSESSNGPNPPEIADGLQNPMTIYFYKTIAETNTKTDKTYGKSTVEEDNVSTKDQSNMSSSTPITNTNNFDVILGETSEDPTKALHKEINAELVPMSEDEIADFNSSKSPDDGAGHTNTEVGFLSTNTTNIAHENEIEVNLNEGNSDVVLTSDPILGVPSEEQTEAPHKEGNVPINKAEISSESQEGKARQTKAKVEFLSMNGTNISDINSSTTPDDKAAKNANADFLPINKTYISDETKEDEMEGQPKTNIDLVPISKTNISEQITGGDEAVLKMANEDPAPIKENISPEVTARKTTDNTTNVEVDFFPKNEPNISGITTEAELQIATSEQISDETGTGPKKTSFDFVTISRNNGSNEIPSETIDSEAEYKKADVVNISGNKNYASDDNSIKTAEDEMETEHKTTYVDIIPEKEAIADFIIGETNEVEPKEMDVNHVPITQTNNSDVILGKITEDELTEDPKDAEVNIVQQEGSKPSSEIVLDESAGTKQEENEMYLSHERTVEPNDLEVIVAQQESSDTSPGSSVMDGTPGTQQEGMKTYLSDERTVEPNDSEVIVAQQESSDTLSRSSVMDGTPGTQREEEKKYLRDKRTTKMRQKSIKFKEEVENWRTEYMSSFSSSEEDEENESEDGEKDMNQEDLGVEKLQQQTSGDTETHVSTDGKNLDETLSLTIYENLIDKENGGEQEGEEEGKEEEEEEHTPPILAAEKESVPLNQNLTTLNFNAINLTDICLVLVICIIIAYGIMQLL